MAGMSTGAQAVESELIESVCERVRERVAPEEVEEAEAFVRAYYKGAPGGGSARTRAGRPLRRRARRTGPSAASGEPGEALVRVYNPTYEQHGWQSPHTAIDIVSDDMPFLVDSVSMELSRREAGIHVLVHPVDGRRVLHAHRGRPPGRRASRSWPTRCAACSRRCAPRSRTGSRCASACRR